MLRYTCFALLFSLFVTEVSAEPYPLDYWARRLCGHRRVALSRWFTICANPNLRAWWKPHHRALRLG